MRHLGFLILASTLGGATAYAQNGQAIYKEHCASGHDAPTGRVPSFSALRQMDAGSILPSLQTGLMKTQAAGLTNQELYALVTYLATPVRKPTTSPPPAAFCDGQNFGIVEIRPITKPANHILRSGNVRDLKRHLSNPIGNLCPMRSRLVVGPQWLNAQT